MASDSFTTDKILIYAECRDKDALALCKYRERYGITRVFPTNTRYVERRVVVRCFRYPFYGRGRGHAG